MTAVPARRRLRAPGEDGQALIDPPFESIAPDFGKVPSDRFGLAGTDARRELVQAAHAYTVQYRDSSIPAFDGSKPILMSGHQPELFHAGVWFKNFLLSSLAARHKAVPINLIVDNDVLDSPAIRVPTGTRQSPRVEAVAFDAADHGIPFEEWRILDRNLFDSFAERTTQQLSPWIDAPLVNDLWQRARQLSQETPLLGQLLPRARHKIEEEWGLQTLEVPLSAVFSRPSFHRFAGPLLHDAARFRELYNAALLEYRSINHVRSRAHPVPELEQDDEWQETPLWIWTTTEPRRRHLFVRPNAVGVEITDRAGFRTALPLKSDDVLQSWSSLEARGVKIRPRALLTTMYARLVLCDLFIHGIGGAKYDELTDAIIRRYFGIEPPPYVTATATVQLPIRYPRITDQQVCDAQHDARQLRFFAERYLHDGRGAELVRKKQQLLRDIPPRGEKKIWHDAMLKVNEGLLPLAADEQRRLNERAAQLGEQYRVSRLLGSREFSFCLYPADFLRPLLLDLSRSKP